MDPLNLVRLTPLMDLSDGGPEIVLGLMDGPVVMDHPDLAGGTIREVPGGMRAGCSQKKSAACSHGTSTAGILSAKRESSAPGICPGCTLLVRPIFQESSQVEGALPSAAPGELATAIVECAGGGARVLNLSVALAEPSSRGERELEEALDYALRQGTIVVTAAGNQGALASSAITRHQWVIPVVACDLHGRPLGESNLGSSIGRRGLSAPGKDITSLGTDRDPHTVGGTSAAAPFVTGAVALLWSIFPSASATEVKSAVTGAQQRRRTTVVPPLLDAWAGYRRLAQTHTPVKEGSKRSDDGTEL
jgi:subtilisin family serine protease